MFECLMCEGQGWGEDVMPDPGDGYGYREIEVTCIACNGTGKSLMLKWRAIWLWRRLNVRRYHQIGTLDRVAIWLWNRTRRFRGLPKMRAR